MTGELEGAAVLGDSADDVVGGCIGHQSLNVGADGGANSGANDTPPKPEPEGIRSTVSHL